MQHIALSIACQALGHWTAPSAEQLELVFRPAVQAGKISQVRRLVTQDLIMRCLCGNSGRYGGGHPCPADRPASMDEVLAHEFFLSDEELDRRIVVPEIPMHIGLTDLMMSYQSSQVMQMKRMAMMLNMIGITTKDGTMVPSGSDWRVWYFKHLKEASVFAPLLSPEFAKSPACFDECREAYKLDKPIVAAMCDADGWNQIVEQAATQGEEVEQAEGQELGHQASSVASSSNMLESIATQAASSHMPVFQKIFEQSRFGMDSVVVPERGDFFDNFWRNFVTFAGEAAAYLGKDKQLMHALHAIIACAPSDLAFAKRLQCGLQSRGLNVEVCSYERDWSEQCDNEARVFMPVISKGFYESRHSRPLVKKAYYQIAHDQRMCVLPIRFQLPAWDDNIDPFLCSWFNRANRIPSNQDFPTGEWFDHYMNEVASAVRRLMTSDRTEHSLVRSRIPKYRSQMHRVVQLPAKGGSFKLKDDREEFLQMLNRTNRADDQAAACEQTKVLFCCSPEDAEAASEIATFLLENSRVPVLCDDVDWFDECQQLKEGDACVVLLTANFVESYECEGRFTYAVDSGVHCVGVVVDRLRYDHLMKAPVTLDPRDLVEQLEGEDAATISTLEAAKNAVDVMDIASCKAYLSDLSQILKVTLTHKVLPLFLDFCLQGQQMILLFARSTSASCLITSEICCQMAFQPCLKGANGQLHLS